MAANLSVAELTTARDNLWAAYLAISTSPTATYTLGDRTFVYEGRFALHAEIKALTREILLRDTSENARGKNRMDFKKWD